MKTDGSGTATQLPGVSTLSRRDLEIIADMIDEGSRVLDVGCGNGALLDYLGRNKGVDGRGIELSQAGVNACVAHGLSVIQGDADTVVTMDDAALWKEAFGGKDDFELTVVEEADHAFSSESHALEVIELTNRFIKSVQQARIED